MCSPPGTMEPPAADVLHELQLLPPGQTKALGVTRLLKQLGVKPENVLAIGDSESDVDTLKLVGKPVPVPGIAQSWELLSDCP